jgi:hypothetical protein
VLSRRAAFLPMRDEAGVIARLREQVLPRLAAADPAFARCQPPRAVHATLARFHRPPPPTLVPAFTTWARQHTLGRARIDSLLMTTETRPYMREGRVVRSYP